MVQPCGSPTSHTLHKQPTHLRQANTEVVCRESPTICVHPSGNEELRGTAQGLGTAFTPEVKDAWTNVFGDIRALMVDAPEAIAV